MAISCINALRCVFSEQTTHRGYDRGHALLEAETLDVLDAYAAAGVSMRAAELEATVTAEPHAV